MVTKLLFKGGMLAGVFANGIYFTIPSWAEYNQFIDNTKHREASTYPITDNTTCREARTYPVLSFSSLLDRYSKFVIRSQNMVAQLSKRDARALVWFKRLNREFADLKELDMRIKEFLQDALSVADQIRTLPELYSSLMPAFEIQWMDIAEYCGRKQRK